MVGFLERPCLAQGAYEIKIQQLGRGPKVLTEGKVLNRIIRATPSGWEVEADPRHIELVVEQLGLLNDKSVATPGVSGQGEDHVPEDMILTAAHIFSNRRGCRQMQLLGA